MTEVFKNIPQDWDLSDQDEIHGTRFWYVGEVFILYYVTTQNKATSHYCFTESLQSADNF